MKTKFAITFVLCMLGSIFMYAQNVSVTAGHQVIIACSSFQILQNFENNGEWLSGCKIDESISNSINISNRRISYINYLQADYPNNSQDAYNYGSRDGGNTYPYLLVEWHHDNLSREEGESVNDISIWADGFDGVKFKWVVSRNNDWYWEFDNFGIFEAPVPGLRKGNV